MNALFNWMIEHPWLLSFIAIGSLVLLAITILATPWIVARLPQDYLVTSKPAVRLNKALHSLVIAFKSALGLLLIVCGLVLMITPGPGIVTLLLGISIAEFPGKTRLMRAIATQPKVFRSLNWMRERYKQAPFDHPTTTIKPS